MSESHVRGRPQQPQQPPAPQAVREEPIAAKFGVVLFDDEKDPGAAWAAVNGGEARRINGPGELSTDTIWWSNMGYDSFFKTTEFWRNPWLRHDGYLIVKPSGVLAEWGRDPANTTPDATAKFVSTVFGRVMMIAFDLAKKCDPKARMSTFFGSNDLRGDLRVLLPKAEYPRGEAGAIMRSGISYAEFTRTTVRSPRNGKLLKLTVPRVSYAHQILATPIPKGIFEHRDRATLRSISADRVGWVRRVDRPCMVEIAVAEMDQDVAPIYGFGNATDKERRTPRSWVAHPEFIAMSSFSKLDVRSAWLGREYGLIGNDLSDPIKKFLSDKFTETSWSAGLIAETLWRAASLPEAGVPKGQRPPPDERAHTSWRGAWFRAADKVSMFTSAMKLSELGYAVTSYGIGWLTLSLAEDQVHDAVRDALTIGLLPRLWDVPDGMFDPGRPSPWGGDRKAQMLSTLTMSKQSDILWNMDKLPLMDGDQRKGLLQKLVSRMQQMGF
jgi:hypothetical protein